MSAWSDTGGIMFGMVFGKSKFAYSISPNKTFEGVIGAVIWPSTVITYIFYYLGQQSDG
jgi:CDP-diglyceride synthetase